MPFWKGHDWKAVLPQKSSQPRMSTQPFVYQKLRDSTEIRVLEVSCDNTDTATRITKMPKLSLKHANLISPMEHGYTAMSYMWGSEDRMDEIIIDDRALIVRADLKNMIRDLGSLNRTRFLWIDAVCINQDDKEERGSQVKLMGNIYSSANYVIAYVKGHDHQNYRTAYKKGRKREFLSLHSVMVSIGNAVTHADPSHLKPDLDYTRFFNNDYFIRRWIIQEICLARSVIIRCDGYELAIGVLDRYFTLFGKSHGFAKSRAARICELRKQISSRKSKIEPLLYRHEHAICADQLDKVYALLSLSQSGERHIPVDYNIRPINLLIELMHTSFLYEQMQESRILSFACFLRQHLEITAGEVERAICNPNWLDDARTDRWLLADVLVRSIRCDTTVDVDVEDGLNRLKQCLPPVRHHYTIRIQQLASTGRKKNAYQLAPNTFLDRGAICGSIEIDALDLYTFSITHSGRHPQKVHAGLSTCLVDVDDEIWQFPRTRVALVVRRDRDDYLLVGRALLINNTAWEPGRCDKTVENLRKNSISLDSILDWVADEESQVDAYGEVEMSGKRTIAMKSAELLGLMRWVDTFADQ